MSPDSLLHRALPLLLLTAAACGTGGDGSGGADSAAPGSTALEAPVMTDPVPAIRYPEGVPDTTATVRLRLFVDEQGHVLPESTRVAETSGLPALDSAAIAGSAELRYAPARRDGRPVATLFVQPIEFTPP